MDIKARRKMYESFSALDEVTSFVTDFEKSLAKYDNNFARSLIDVCEKRGEKPNIRAFILYDISPNMCPVHTTAKLDKAGFTNFVSEYLLLMPRLQIAVTEYDNYPKEEQCSIDECGDSIIALSTKLPEFNEKLENVLNSSYLHNLKSFLRHRAEQRKDPDYTE